MLPQVFQVVLLLLLVGKDKTATGAMLILPAVMAAQVTMVAMLTLQVVEHPADLLIMVT